MTQPTAGKATAGVLQIPAAATQKSTAPAKKAPKPPTPRLKLLIRRLPPGLTQPEFEGALGEEWKAGAGKVDWLHYKPGKVSKDPAKPSRPSRAYIHVVSNEHIGPLSDQVRQSSFQDAGHTSNDPVLLGPPTLEFAPYAKTPGSRVRKDARQGTIDQDPEFIAFLESLTQPITKPAPVDAIEADEKKAAVITPLVQFIKDKKASKAKESGSSKSSKRSEKESKQEKVQAKKLLQRSDKKLAPGPSSDEKSKGDKAAKESVKATKQAASGTSTKGGKASSSSTTKENTSATASERKRERGNVTAAAKILQRDLGLSPSASSRRRGKGGSNETGSPKNESSREPFVPAAEGNKKESISKPAKSAASSTKTKDRDGGESPSSRTSGAATPPATKSSKVAKTKAAPRPAPTATQAFLKHANASQGVTEALLEAAFTLFGTVTKVEIDKKKGFGYVDFTEPEGLQKAMAASPVSIAQSQVVVLERKANPGGEKSRKAGGGRGDPPQQAKGDKTKATEGNSGGNSGSGGGPAGSSRGSRGGRGSRNKGLKGGAAGNGTAAGPAEKSVGSDAK
ncbi:uncharacterized protein N7482_006408 [Penicillium canariense]|uniref:RRM domain-containing protein n=1 Tax=Penicillium canariense TaxID=189055 RepID=A0A9W9HUI0_9EURO|nr:uncharacterized protein N7482_006408 [Penicillium canariense]KAJ5159404.1 hypothetical protein N7482_006408 [Penicillium canariense]